MSITFEKDSETLAERGDWKLVIYAKRCISLLSKCGSEIKTLSMCAEENEDGTLTDESVLIDKLCDLYMEKVNGSQWRPIDTAPKDEKVFFWITPKVLGDPDIIGNTSGEPILSKNRPHKAEGMYGCCWNALEKATHWHPNLPEPPTE